jgi:hypothetical protein
MSATIYMNRKATRALSSFEDRLSRKEVYLRLSALNEAGEKMGLAARISQIEMIRSKAIATKLREELRDIEARFSVREKPEPKPSKSYPRSSIRERARIAKRMATKLLLSQWAEKHAASPHSEETRTAFAAWQALNSVTLQAFIDALRAAEAKEAKIAERVAKANAAAGAGKVVAR